MKTLRLDGLTKSFGKGAGPVVDTLTLSVPSGSLTALLGPSGSGKSTVLRMIAGLVEPDAGGIWLGDASLLAVPADRRGVVLMFQNAHLFPHMTLAENIGFGLRMRGLAAGEIAPQVAAMLDRVQLSGLGHRRPHELSGGQAQRGALARALVLKPCVLLLDEPLSNLDATLRDGMRRLIRDLQRETGTTMLIVTHDQSEAVALADRVGLLLEGRLAQEAPPREIFRRPASVAVARFFGGVNFLKGTADDQGFHCALGTLPLAKGALRGSGILTIRPEAIRLGAAPDARLAKVLGSAFLGTQAQVSLEIGGQKLEALTTPEVAAGLSPGSEVAVSFPVEETWIVPRDPVQPPERRP